MLCLHNGQTTDLRQNLAQFIRTHEKALANALQLSRRPPNDGRTENSVEGSLSATRSTASSALATALSFGTFHFSSHHLKPAKLELTPHHLYYLLDQFQEIGIHIGPMNVRLENIHTQASPANYVSFLSESQRSRGRSDHESIHSVSSVRSVVSSVSTLLSGFGFASSTSTAKNEKANLQSLTDLKYLYSAFTKIPCLRLSLDHKARLISGYEEFPFDTAVPLLAFKNVSVLEIRNVDFRQFYGWDKLAEQLRSLTVKRSVLEDPADILTHIVLDDMDRRRRRSPQAQSSPVLPWPASPSHRVNDPARSDSSPSSPVVANNYGHSPSPKHSLPSLPRYDFAVRRQRSRTKSTSPSRLRDSQQETHRRHIRAIPMKTQRSGSGSSNSSTNSSGLFRTGSASNILLKGILPASKWRFLRHLSMSDNSLTSIPPTSLAPLANTLQSLDLSSNLFVEIPDCLLNLAALRALDISNCMINSLHSMNRNPMPAIVSLNLRNNRLVSIAGIERLLSLQRLDLRENRLQDPMELARLTSIPKIREIWVLQNAFVKTHGDYRLTIFNLFRDTPGYCADVILDSSPPGYSERRHLRDYTMTPARDSPDPPRPAEVAKVPCQRESPPCTASSTGSLEGGRPSLLQITQSETAIASNRRRKGPRRRMVDLAGDESALGTQQLSLQMESPKLVSHPALARRATEEPLLATERHLYQIRRDQRSLPLPGPNRILSDISPPEISDNERCLALGTRSSTIDGEIYRQKIEALKHEVGNNCTYSPD